MGIGGIRMKQSEKIRLLEEKVIELEESIKVLMSLNLEQLQTVVFQLDRVEKNLSKLLCKQM